MDPYQLFSPSALDFSLDKLATINAMCGFSSRFFEHNIDFPATTLSSDENITSSILPSFSPPPVPSPSPSPSPTQTNLFGDENMHPQESGEEFINVIDAVNVLNSLSCPQQASSKVSDAYFFRAVIAAVLYNGKLYVLVVYYDSHKLWKNPKHFSQQSADRIVVDNCCLRWEVWGEFSKTLTGTKTFVARLKRMIAYVEEKLRSSKHNMYFNDDPDKSLADVSFIDPCVRRFYIGDHESKLRKAGVIKLWKQFGTF